MNKVGQKIGSEGIAFSWLVTGPATQVQYFKAGFGTTGQRLATVLNNVLQCEIDRLKPAQTTVYYDFS